MHAQAFPARSTLDLGVSVWDCPQVQLDNLNPTKIGVPVSCLALQKSQEKMRIAGKQVAAARELLGITQSELAEAAGVGIVRYMGLRLVKPRHIRPILRKLELRSTNAGLTLPTETALQARAKGSA